MDWSTLAIGWSLGVFSSIIVIGFAIAADTAPGGEV